MTLSGRCPSESHLSSAPLCAASPGTSLSPCSRSPAALLPAKADWVYIYMDFLCLPFCLYQIVAFSLGEAIVHLQIGCCCRLADCFVFHWARKILLLSRRDSNPCLEKKMIIFFPALLAKLLACTCQVTCQGFRKEKLDLSLSFSGLKMVKAGMKNGGLLRGALSALKSTKRAILILFVFMGQLQSSQMP